MADLFADVNPPIDTSSLSIPDDFNSNGFHNLAFAETPTFGSVGGYEGRADAVAYQVLGRVNDFVQCDRGAMGDDACATQFIRKLLTKARRRPLDDATFQRYFSLYSKTAQSTYFDKGIFAVVEAVLQSPQFVYRVAFGDPPGQGEARQRLAGYELAERMSYFLWNSLPDDALLAAAASGQLAKSDGIAREARRLLANPKAHQAVAEFHRQWLKSDLFYARILNKSYEILPPEFNPYDYNEGALRLGWGAYADSLYTGLEKFLDWAFWQGGGLPALFGAKKAFVDNNTKFVYGLTPSPFAPPEEPSKGFTLIDTPNRAGLLGQAGWLAGEGHSTEDAPVLRGVFVLDHVLCQPPPAPPANVNTSLPSIDPNQPRTTRQLFEQTHEQGACAGCHHLIDGVGFGLGGFDAIGRSRTVDNGLPVDATGQLTAGDHAGPFVGELELAQKLVGSEQVASCFAKQWFGYAVGRNVVQADANDLLTLRQILNSSNGDLRELLVGICQSTGFTTRPVVSQ